MKQKLIKHNKIISIILLLGLTTSAYFMFFKQTETAVATWWNDSWSYRKALTINSDQVTGDLTNFPVLVSLTDTNLSSHAQEDGDDFIFIDKEGKKLSHEIESYASSTGVLVAWVKILSLSSTADTDIYMYYGNAGIGSQADSENVWDDGFLGIYHLDEDVEGDTGGHSDSTTNFNHGSGESTSFTFPSQVTGKMGYGQNFDVEERIDLGGITRWNSMGTNDAFTISTWVNMDTLNVDRCLVCQSDNSSEGVLFWMDAAGAGTGYLSYYYNITTYVGSADADNATTSDWQYVVINHDGTNSNIYLDGVSIGGPTAITYVQAALNFSIGSVNGNSTARPMDGQMDEVRISNVARTQAWIETEYSNQNNPSAFFAEQAEEVGPGPVGYWSFDEGYGMTAHDESGQGNDGVITGAVWKNEEECVTGKCLYFDGSGDYINLGNDQSINNLPDGLSISAWVKTSDNTNYGYIFSQNNAAETNLSGVMLGLSGSNLAGSLTLSLDDGDGSGSYDYIRVNSQLQNNQWYHVYAIWDGTDGLDGVEIYVDGVQITDIDVSPNGTRTYDKAEGSSIIGRRLFDSQRDYVGYIDELKVYPYTRTPNQILQDYVSGQAGISSSKGSSVTFGSQSSNWMSDGLVGYWKFDETATTSGAIDSSGNGNDGTYENTASTTGGKFGNGGIFDGDNDYISIPNSSADLSGNFSVSMWVNPDDNSENPRWFSLIDGSNNLELGHMNDDTVYFRFADSVVETNWTIAYGDWYHIIWIYEDGKRTIYVNNEEKLNSSGGITSNAIMSAIGGGYSATSYTADGQIDEVRVYNRALSKSEVRKLYEWAPGPVMHLKMDEKSGTTAYDVSGYGNDGTINGASWDRGRYGNALSFDGTNDSVDVTFDEDIFGGITESFWIYVNILPSEIDEAFQDIIGLSDDTLNLFFRQSSGNLEWKMPLNTGDTRVTVNESYLNKNQWNYVAATYDGSYKKIYIDGIERGSATVSGEIVDNGSDSMKIGRNTTGPNYYFDGKIDDVKIYNYARTQKQILEDMSGSASGGNQSKASKMPVLHLSFDEGRGETVHDSSIYGNDGTAYVGTGGSQTATSSMWEKSGKVKGAMEFDGTDDYVNGSSLSLDNWTASVWYKWNANTGFEQSLVSNWDGTNRILIGVNPNDPTDEVFVVTSNDYYERFNGLSYEDGVFHHFLYTWDGSNVKFYFDGIDQGAADETGDPSDNTQNAFRVGASLRSSTDRFVDGLIDEVKIWNYALSEDEIKEEYNHGSSFVMGEAKNADDNGTTVTGDSTKYCVPGDTDQCSPPVLELKMNEKIGGTAYDTSGNGNDGTLTWMSTSTNGGWVRGESGSALQFDGVDDYVIQSNDFDFPEVTVEGWFKQEESDDGWIYNKFADISNGWGVRLIGGTIGIYDDLDNADNTRYATSYEFNKWNHFAAVLDNLENKLYLNGILVGSGGIAGEDFNLTQSGINQHIGRRRSSTNYLKGYIDGIRVFDYPRTSAQIAWDYNKGKPIAHYKFDECSGSVIHDSSGNGNDGALNLGASGVTATGTCASSSDSFWWNGKDGRVKNSGSFDGGDDYVNCGSGTSIRPTDRISISAWVKLIDDGTSDYIVSSAIDSGTADNGVGLFHDTGSGVVRFFVNHWSANAALSSITYNEWFHIVGTYDMDASSNQINIYVNGILGSPDTYSTAINYEVGEETVIGAAADGSSALEGNIDDVRIYNYAMTEEQIKNVYNDGAVSFR